MIFSQHWNYRMNYNQIYRKYCIHGFIGERMPSKESTKLLVKRIAENFKLPYFTITPTFSICPVHGYLAGEHEYCPKCDAEMGYQPDIA